MDPTASSLEDNLDTLVNPPIPPLSVQSRTYQSPKKRKAVPGDERAVAPGARSLASLLLNAISDTDQDPFARAASGAGP